MRKITTIRLDEADRAASATIRHRYGVASDSDAIRLALRVVAESKRVDLRQDADNGNADNGNADNGNADNGNADNGNADDHGRRGPDEPRISDSA